MSGTILYLSYGKDCYQQETMFSILSAKFLSQDSESLKIIVYTDKPYLFTWLGVEIRELTKSLEDQWIAGGTYPFRLKVACLLHLLELEGGKVAFIDGDTFFLKNPERLFDRIGPGRACLHLREIRLTRRRNTAGLLLGDLLAKGIVRDLDGQPVTLRSGESMWNSGVIGIDALDRFNINRSLHLIDQLWSYETRIHTVEQFAIGHVLAEEQLSEVDDIVFHYWHKRYRVAFLQKLPGLLDQARHMPRADAAKWIYGKRPRASPAGKVASALRTTVHRIGLDHRWTRISA